MLNTKQGKDFEFSKVIFWLVWSTNLAVIIFVMAVILIGYKNNGYIDSSPFIYLIPSVAAELASATGFYYWKTRTNNVYEYGEKFILDLVENDKLDAQYIAAIAQAFFMNQQFN